MVLAPQLRQSLEMLQVPVLELRTMIRKEMEQNPTIEESPVDQPSVEIEPDVKGNEDASELNFEKEYEALAKLDDEWRDYFYQERSSIPYNSDREDKRQYFLNSLPQEESLQEHLTGQLNLAGLSDTDREIGELIVGSIGDDGYLPTSLEELAEAASFDVRHMEDVLAVIQDFHPVGVGARDLRECLLIQLNRMGKGESLAARIVRDHLNKLGAHKYQDIARSLQCSAEDVQNAAKLIATLDPKPGSIYSSETAAYVLPEITVQKVEGEYVVIMDDDQLPHVRISKQYRKLMQSAETNPDVKQYIRERIRSGAFLIKSIQQRQKTIYRIATEIVSRQKDFLDKGVAFLKPMTMAEIAEKVGVHETTVSRAVSGKYMRTPSGVFELKYFFSPGISTSGGQEVSNRTVKDIIAKLVAEEDPSKPLSDQEIVAQLKEQGITVARRTVAKYRTVLRIPPSHMRKLY
jgi:RNA polymerase sigma-54 factor